MTATSYHIHSLGLVCLPPAVPLPQHLALEKLVSQAARLAKGWKDLKM